MLVGHSISGVIATIYAARYPTTGIVNVDQPLGVEPFAELVKSLADRLQSPAFPDVWQMFWASMHIELLPGPAQKLLRATSRPQQDLVVGYWRDLLDRPVAELVTWVNSVLATIHAAHIPYEFVLGHHPGTSEQRWLGDALPQATVTVLPNSGHFPHLADPLRFAERLARTAGWQKPDTV